LLPSHLLRRDLLLHERLLHERLLHRQEWIAAVLREARSLERH
jgi:hypothetical protein